MCSFDLSTQARILKLSGFTVCINALILHCRYYKQMLCKIEVGPTQMHEAVLYALCNEQWTTAVVYPGSAEPVSVTQPTRPTVIVHLTNFIARTRVTVAPLFASVHSCVSSNLFTICLGYSTDPSDCVQRDTFQGHSTESLD